jgi:hypothetical protein
LVRRFSSDDILRKTNPDEMEFPMYWIHDPQPISAKAGMHRFVWDLHYAFPADVHVSFYGPSAPHALPGRYTVKLTVNGKSYEQPLVVKMDPRVKTPPADLQTMFSAESLLARNVAELSTAMRQAQDLQASIATRNKEAGSKVKVSEALTALDRKTAELVGTEKDADFGIFGLAIRASNNGTVRQALWASTGLLTVVGASDAAPGADAALAVEKWDAATKEFLERWKTFWREDRQRANDLLQKAKLKPL